MTQSKRPEAYENLIGNKSLKESDRDEDELQQYIAVGASMLKDARKADLSAHSRYMLAYDGIHSLAMAVLLHYGTRPGDGHGHRTIALQKFIEELKLGLGMRKVILDAHDRRNETTYRSALPPLSHKDAESVIAALSAVLPGTITLVGSPRNANKASPIAPAAKNRGRK
jgi:hypothetical protein